MTGIQYLLQQFSGYTVLIPGGIIMGMTVNRFIPNKGNWLYRLIPVLFFSLVIGIPSWIGDENPLIIFPFFAAVFLICYTGPWYARLIISTIFYSLLLPMNMMIDSAPTRTLGSFTYILIAIKTLLWGLFLLLARRLVTKERTLIRSVKLWALLGGLSLAPLFATLSFTFWNARWFPVEAYNSILRFGYTILPFSFLSALALLAALILLSRHEELELQQKLAEIQAVYYQGLQREQSEVHTLRHDLRNHVLVAQSLLRQGDVSGAEQYLEELSDSIALIGFRHICDNDIANAVLSSKLSIMEIENMQSDWQISLPKQLAIPDIELCALLGNAVDNAIEAVRDAQDKRIIIRARADKGILMLRVENALGNRPHCENGVFKTTKDHVAMHGFGLASMQEIVRKYNGSLDAIASNGRFELIVSVPLAESK